MLTIPIVIFVGCFSAAIVAAARWLPELAAGSVGGLAFFTVAGLLGAAAGLVGLNIYEIVRALTILPNERLSRPDLLASGLRSLLIETGTLVGLAAIVYLLAPAPEDELGESPPTADAGQTA